MPINQTEIDAFNASLKGALPRLRVYALSLTRDRDRADNLVQQTSLKALAGRESFRPGTNFGGWIFRIERNEFLSELRREQRTANTVNAESVLATPPAQEYRLIMREFMAAFRQLSQGSRQALILSKVAGHSYEQIASHAGIAEGTVKSRIWRGRAGSSGCSRAMPVGQVRARRRPFSARPAARCRLVTAASYCFELIFGLVIV